MSGHSIFSYSEDILFLSDLLNQIDHFSNDIKFELQRNVLILNEHSV